MVSRSDLFIVSKLWNSDHAPDRVPKALEKTLKALKARPQIIRFTNVLCVMNMPHMQISNTYQNLQM